MTTDAAEVAVVVASHSRPECLAQVLASVEAQQDVRFEVVVVDNKSAKSDAVAAVVAEFPRVRLVRLDDNLGFGRSVNRGIAATTAPFLYFACDDVLLGECCLRRLLDAMTERSTVGLAAGVAYAHQSPHTIRYAGGEHAFRSLAKLSMWSAIPPDAGDRPYLVTFVPGGMLMVRRGMLESLGGYREDFYMYSEDVELSVRARRVGWELVVVPTAVVFDLGPPPTFDRGVVTASKVRNHLAVTVLHAPGRWLPIILVRELVGGLRRLFSISRADRRAWWQGWGHFLASFSALARDRARLDRLAKVSAQARRRAS